MRHGRTPRRAAAGYHVGDSVYYVGASETFAVNGDRLSHGSRGEVVGPATASIRTKGEGVSFEFYF